MNLYLIAFNTLLALGAYYKKSLSLSGGICAFIVGLGIGFLGGVQGYLLMGAFFVTSSILTKIASRRGKDLHLEELHEKMDVRDWTQVLSNAIIPLCFLALYKLSGEVFYWIGFVTAFASSNADTWASEVGVLSKTPPRTLLGKKSIRAGLSGGVTPLGLAASLAGALVIAGFDGFLTLLGHLLSQEQVLLPAMGFFIALSGQVVLVSFFGFFGALLDSLMGELLQAKYKTKDPSGLITERVQVHIKNELVETELVSGLSWLNNNRVNLMSTAIASICSTFVAALLIR